MNGSCPRCDGGAAEVPEEGAAGGSLGFEFSSASGQPRDPEIDWRAELKRRLEHHAQKRQSSEDLPEVDEEPPDSSPDPKKKEDPSSIFKYTLGRPPRPGSGRKIVTFSRRIIKEEPVTEKPLIRLPAKPPAAKARGEDSDQKQLDFSSRGEATETPVAEIQEPLQPAQELSKEVFFSRLLAGIVDLLSWLLLSGLLTALAAYIADFEIFSANGLWLLATLGTVLYLVSSFFFLATTGQTPGMYLTELELIDEKTPDPAWSSIGLRVLIFLPTVVTLVGLIWGLFDPWCRCLHDRLSQTRVVPLRSAP